MVDFISMVNGLMMVYLTVMVNVVSIFNGLLDIYGQYCLICIYIYIYTHMYIYIFHMYLGGNLMFTNVPA